MLKVYVVKDMKLTQDSVFETKDFYKLLTKWFELNDFNFYEKEYLDTDETIGKRIEIYWTAEKGVNSYVKWVIDISLFILGLNKVEIEKGGVKTKTDKSTLTIQITAYMAKDYDGEWSNTAAKKSMRMIYDRFIIRKRLERLEGELKNQVDGLTDEIRSFLEMHKL